VLVLAGYLVTQTVERSFHGAILTGLPARPLKFCGFDGMTEAYARRVLAT
jgi:hypothetical protein